jgi:hypothetical protein
MTHSKMVQPDTERHRKELRKLEKNLKKQSYGKMEA